MQRLIRFVAKYKEYFSYTALVIISLSLISMGNVGKIGGFRSVIIASTGTLQSFFAWIPNPVALRSENRALRELNLELTTEVIKSRQAINENNVLRRMLGYREKTEFPLIPCEVVGKTTIELRNYIMLNKGSGAGVREGMSVRTDAGIVGNVVGLSKDYSMVELIQNKNIRISAKVERNNVNGIVVWNGGESFLMKNIPESYDVRVGDNILTSNFSNKYPQDVLIGQVIDSRKDPSSLFYKITLKPSVNFSTLEQVFVIDYLPDPDRLKLIEEIEAKLNERKGKL